MHAEVEYLKSVDLVESILASEQFEKAFDSFVDGFLGLGSNLEAR